MKYLSLNSAIRPVPHSDEIAILVFQRFTFRDIEKFDHEDANHFIDMSKNDNDIDFKDLSSELKVFDQVKLRNIIRDFFIKRIGGTLTSSLKEKNLLKEEKVHVIPVDMLTLPPTAIIPTNLYFVTISKGFCCVLVSRTMMQIHGDYLLIT